MSLTFLTISSQPMKYFNPFVLSNWGSHPSHQNIYTLSRSKLSKLDFASTQMVVNMTLEYCFGFTWQNWKLSMQNYPEFVEDVILKFIVYEYSKKIRCNSYLCQFKEKCVICFISVFHREKLLSRNWSLYRRRKGMLVDFSANFKYFWNNVFIASTCNK